MNALSPDTRRLLTQARSEGPSEASRRHILGAVLAQTTVAAAAMPSATQTGATLATKAALGVLLGAAVTVGLAATLLVARAHGAATVGPDVPVAIVDRTPTSVSPPPAAMQPIMGASPKSEAKVLEPPPASHAALSGASQARFDGPPADPMEREARLVAEARAALLRGDPATAVTKVHAAQALPVRQMEPEELRVLAKALRALGDDKGASRAQTELVMRYPGEASP
ncbi:MAG TPA: hypothetical protein VF316_23575 [Polyangiaceae bacterium]